MRRSTTLLTILVLFAGSHGRASARSADGPAPVPVPIPAPSQELAVLVEGLAATDPEARAQAAWDLASVKGAGAGVLGALRAATRDRDRRVRYAAAWALSRAEQDAAGAETGPDPYEVAARPLRTTQPAYPLEAFQKKVQGRVVVDVLIGEDGEVAFAQVAESIPGLDEAALECVRAWRFEPAQMAGRPVASVAQVPMRFTVAK